MERLAKLGGSLPTLRSNQPTLPRQENYGQGRGGRPWRRLKRDVHVRDNWTCCQCQRVTMDLECDHIVNKAQGGTDDMDNLQSLCKECHSKKTQQESRQGQAMIKKPVLLLDHQYSVEQLAQIGLQRIKE